MWAFLSGLTLASLLSAIFFSPPSALGCKSESESVGPMCAKTHKFPEDMASITKLEKEVAEDCGKWRKGLCATGRFQYDSKLLDKQTGVIFKSCAFYNFPKNILDGSCEPWRLGKKRTVFFICVCKSNMCNKGENQTKHLLKKELQYTWRVYKPPKRPKDHEVTKKPKDLVKSGEEIPDMQEDEDYIYGNHGNRKKCRALNIFVWFAAVAVKNAVMY